MLVSRIIPNQQNRRRVIHVAHRSCEVSFSVYRSGECRQVRRPVMINIVCLQNHARELLEKVILFVSGTRRADDAYDFAAIAINKRPEALANQLKSLLPCGWNQAPALANQRLS